MSRIETSAKSLILHLMNQKTSIMTLTDADRTALARWATKTAFMIAVVQTTRFDLPWGIFQNLGLHEEDGPNGSIVLATLQPQMPKEFLIRVLGIIYRRDSPFRCALDFPFTICSSSWSSRFCRPREWSLRPGAAHSSVAFRSAHSRELPARSLHNSRRLTGTLTTSRI